MKAKQRLGAAPVKPRVFIGSAGESKNVAHKIFAGIEDLVEAVVWTRAFRPGDYTLEAIVEKLELSDFGVFVFTPDDVADIRQRRFKVARDNVIFELGLFIGRLGRKRCIAVVPRGVDKLHLPSDLLGITFANYDPKRSDGELAQALVPVCEAIRDTVMAYGRYKPSHEDASKQLVRTFAAWLSEDVSRPLGVAKGVRRAKGVITESLPLIGRQKSAPLLKERL